MGLANRRGREPVREELGLPGLHLRGAQLREAHLVQAVADITQHAQVAVDRGALEHLCLVEAVDIVLHVLAYGHGGPSNELSLLVLLLELGADLRELAPRVGDPLCLEGPHRLVPVALTVLVLEDPSEGCLLAAYERVGVVHIHRSFALHQTCTKSLGARAPNLGVGCFPSWRRLPAVTPFTWRYPRACTLVSEMFTQMVKFTRMGSLVRIQHRPP